MSRAQWLVVFFLINLLPAAAAAEAPDPPSMSYGSGESAYPIYVKVSCPDADVKLLVALNPGEDENPALGDSKTRVFAGGEWAVLVRKTGTVKTSCVNSDGEMSTVVEGKYTIGPQKPDLDHTFNGDVSLWKKFTEGCLQALVIGPKCTKCTRAPKAPRFAAPPPPAGSSRSETTTASAALNLNVPNSLKVETEDKTPIYKKWQFWVGVSAVVVAGAVVAGVCGAGYCDGGDTTVTVRRSSALVTF